jgi:DNA modification methylase
MKYAPRVICGDCIKVGKQMLSKPLRYHLVFGDPPFNIGQEYSNHDDNMGRQAFGRFMHQWLSVGSKLVTWTGRGNGLFAIHGNDEVAAITLNYLTSRNMERKHWNIWHYRFGQAGALNGATKCITSKAHLLVWSRKGAKTTFNPPVVLSDRATKYADKRTQQTQTPGQRVALDVWGVEGDGPYWGRVQGNSKERWCKATGAPCDHPNQLPEVYMRRVIETYTNPNDRMLVMFGGSGTETVVANSLGRKVTTIEKSSTCCKSIRERLIKGPVRV